MADNEKLMKPVIRLVITLICLAIIGGIVRALPGMNNAIPGMYLWTVPTIISSIIAVIMILVLLRFAFTIGPVIQEQYPNSPELRVLAKNAVFLVCLVIAYGSFRYLVYPLMYEFVWLYDIAFLVVGLYLAYIIATILMKSSDKWSDAIMHDVKEATSTGRTCKKCGTSNPPANKFCDKCGSHLG